MALVLLHAWDRWGKESVKARQGGVCPSSITHFAKRTIAYVIEDIVAAAIGLALVVYLAYALARLERF